MKKKLAVLLCVTMLLGLLTACTPATTGTPSTDPAVTTADTGTQKETTQAPETSKPNGDDEEFPYLNLDSSWPVIKEGHDISLTAYFTWGGGAGNSGVLEKNWYLQYLLAESNIDLEITQIAQDVMAEQKNLIMMSGELPDILYGFGISASEQVNYGQNQQLLLNCKEYINPELTPNIHQRFQDRPDAEDSWTLPDGGIYALGRISSNKNPALINTYYWNMDYLADLGYDEMPITLDETIEAFYAFKEADPFDLGENCIPVGGSAGYWASFTDSFMSNFGFINGGTGAALCLRNGEVVYGSYEDDFVHYLEVMSGFFKDGIISPDYYTMDSAAHNALCGDGHCLVVAGPPYVTVTDKWAQYWSFIPCTSDWNSKQVLGIGNGQLIGGWAASAATEYPEVCMRFVDWFFTDENAMLVRHGPPDNDVYGTSYDYYDLFEHGWSIVDDEIMYGDLTMSEFANSEGYSGDRVTQLFMGNYNESVGTERNYYLGDGYNNISLMKAFVTGEWEEFTYNLNDGDEHYRNSNTQNSIPYTTPRIETAQMFFDEETNDRIADLSTLINEYADSEIAKFIAGVRPVSEFADYQKELADLGVDEYIQIYKDAYNN